MTFSGDFTAAWDDTHDGQVSFNFEHSDSGEYTEVVVDLTNNYNSLKELHFSMTHSFNRISVSGPFVAMDNLIVTIPELMLSDADFDSDGDVDGTDFLLWQAGYPTSTGATHMLGDADYDGDVDGIDFLLWQRNYPYPAALSSVPEPNSLALLAISGLLMLRRRRT